MSIFPVSFNYVKHAGVGGDSIYLQNAHPDIHLHNSVFRSLPASDLALYHRRCLPRHRVSKSDGVQDIPKDKARDTYRVRDRFFEALSGDGV